MGNHTYEININNNTQGSKQSPIAGNDTPATDTTVKGNGKMSAARLITSKAIGATNTYIKPFVDQMWSQHVTTISLRTGAQEQEERLSFKTDMVKRGVDFGLSISVGAALGGGFGALIGGFMGFVTTAVDYGNQKEKLDLERRVENVGLRYLNNRAGGTVASFNRSRQKNQ